MQQIQFININQLSEHPDNPRLIKSGKFKDLCESIKRNQDYFETRPILCTMLPTSTAFAGIEHPLPRFRIFAGTMRFRAAKEIGMTHVPCVVMDIPESRQREIMVRDNQSSGEWDVQKLALFGEPLLIDAGFTKVELHDKFAIFREAEDDGFDADAEREKITEPKTKPGELIQLGRHWVKCGDSTNRDDVADLMKNERADVLFTDPPYNVNYSYDKYDGIGSQRKRKFKDNGHIFNDDKTPEQFYDMLLACFKNAYDFSKPTAPAYVCHATKTYAQFHDAFVKAGWHWSQNIIWLKTRISGGFSQDFLHCSEQIMYGWKTGEDHYSNPAIKNSRDVYDLEGLDLMERLDVWKVAREPIAETEHITPKPIKLIEIPLRKSMPPQGIVLDPFAGGGSTLIAAEQMGASARLIEIDPKWCDVIRARWERYQQMHGESSERKES